MLNPLNFYDSVAANLAGMGVHNCVLDTKKSIDMARAQVALVHVEQFSLAFEVAVITDLTVVTGKDASL